MLKIERTARWQQLFAGGHIGVLLIANVDNTPRPTPLDAHKRQTEQSLRETYAGVSRTALRQIPILQAYRTYYKAFGKSYHVRLQLESVVQKGKSLPTVSPLVDANFAAELQTLVLTAAHDVDKLALPLTIDATVGDERFVQLGGKSCTLKPNDMLMRDAHGIICTILYGQDNRTFIAAETTRALYVAYAPIGVPVAAIEQQFALIHQYVLLAAPIATVEMRSVYHAEGHHV